MRKVNKGIIDILNFEGKKKACASIKRGDTI